MLLKSNIIILGLVLQHMSNIGLLQLTVMFYNQAWLGVFLYEKLQIITFSRQKVMIHNLFIIVFFLQLFCIILTLLFVSEIAIFFILFVLNCSWLKAILLHNALDFRKNEYHSKCYTYCTYIGGQLYLQETIFKFSFFLGYLSGFYCTVNEYKKCTFSFKNNKNYKVFIKYCTQINSTVKPTFSMIPPHILPDTYKNMESHVLIIL